MPSELSLDLQIVHEALPAYDIGKEIGRGGGGVVLSATHRHLGRRVAIKQLPRAFSSDEAVRDRFYEEARLAASLDHPHIVPVYDYVEHGGVCLIVMELMTHGSLWARHHREGLMPDEACGVVLAVLSALEYAHSKLCVHRDVKPDNVLFGPGGVVKLSDFGIAKVLGGGGGRTMSGEVVGTPAYMAPEQASGEAVGPGTDVYATGVVLYELLAGRLPFPATSSPVQQLYQHVHEQPAPLLEVAPSVSPVVAEVVMRSIAKDPAERYGRAETFGVALARAAAEAFGPRWVHHCGVELLTSAEIAEAAVWQPTGAQPRVAPPAPDQASTGAPSGTPAAPPGAGAD
ncbi:MAG: serine/threonine-protein kinase, partial [Acidimicrobiales bacterium]